MIGYYIIGGIFMLISMFVSGRLKSKFKKYSQTQLKNNLSGKEIAELMLKQNGITDVQVVQVNGQLTDHYNPVNKTVNLSEAVYSMRNAAAAAVASHECGHAIQHAEAYAWLTMRSKLVPMVNISSRYMTWVIMGGLIVLSISANPYILMAGIALFAVTTLFSFVTLPVEFDASKRALAWIKTNNIVTEQEYDGAKDALKWAALTYVVAALGSLATLLYYVSLLMDRR